MKTYSTKKLLVIFGSLFSVYGLIAIGLARMEDKETIWNYASNLYLLFLFLVSAAFIWRKARKLRAQPSVARVFYIWAISLFAWAFGLSVWGYYNLIAKVDVPYPSLADIGFFTLLLLLGISMWFLQDIYEARSNTPFLTSIPILIVSVLAVFIVFNRPDLSSELSGLQRFTNFAFSLGDAFLLSMTIVVAQAATQAKVRKTIYPILFAFLILSVTDFIFFYSAAHGTYYNGSLSDVMYGFFAASFAVAAGINYNHFANRATPASSEPIEAADANNPMITTA